MVKCTNKFFGLILSKGVWLEGDDCTVARTAGHEMNATCWEYNWFYGGYTCCICFGILFKWFPQWLELLRNLTPRWPLHPLHQLPTSLAGSFSSIGPSIILELIYLWTSQDPFLSTLADSCVGLVCFAFCFHMLVLCLWWEVMLPCGISSAPRYGYLGRRRHGWQDKQNGKKHPSTDTDHPDSGGLGSVCPTVQHAELLDAFETWGLAQEEKECPRPFSILIPANL